MPRYNNDGRSAKFIHTGGGGGGGGGGRGGGFQGDRVKFNDFKLSSNRAIKKKNRGPKAFQRLDEAGDVIMSGEPQPSSSGRFMSRGYGRKKNRHLRRDRHDNDNRNRRNDFLFGPGWHKITIFDGTSFSRDVILSSLLSATRIPFTPIAYAVSGTNTTFLVEERAMAEALAECHGKINLGDDKMLRLRIQPCGFPPTSNFDVHCEARVRAELERRFNVQLQTLSLSNFLMSPDLIRDFFLPLNRASVVVKLLSLVEPQLNNLVGLDLSSNKLVNLEGFGTLPKKAPNLKAINFGKNKFRDINVLDKLHGMQIVELILEENPVCNNYNEKDKYISDVRKRFPKVTKLDGVDIPPPVTFEVNEPARMPEIRGSSFCNEEAKKVVLTFWEQYLACYDSDDRQPLVQAYHETATMSLMSSYAQQGHVSQMDPTKKLSAYLSDSRNLFRNPDKHRKYKLLHQGKLDIVAFLQKLPKTIHDPASIMIDMPVAVENFILFNVVGLIKEREERSNPVRYFSRTFAIVPLNGGFVIVNELYFITNPTSDQLKGAFKPVSAPTAAIIPTAAVPGPAPISIAAAAPVVPASVPTENEKQVMLNSFCEQSGMNADWSRKCLEENAWDFNQSAFVFSQLKEQGKIPPEAFVK